MKYNPAIHHRRSIRLAGYDYSQAGLYFITVCCHDMRCRFGRIENGTMILNDYGKIAHREWAKLPERFSNLELDAFQIMPNHLHAILAVRATLAVAPPAPPASSAPSAPSARRTQRAQPQGVAPTVGDVVGAYKSIVATECLKIFKSKNQTMGKLWQRNYYEHIIRNEHAYHTISQYIMDNPAKWNADKFHR